VADEKREVTRPLWLYLLEEGGRWTASELARTLSFEINQACAALSQMHTRGMVKRHVPTEYGKTMAYEVDDSCRLPDNSPWRMCAAATTTAGRRTANADLAQATALLAPL
jgi:hypothetical protein